MCLARKESVEDSLYFQIEPSVKVVVEDNVEAMSAIKDQVGGNGTHSGKYSIVAEIEVTVSSDDNQKIREKEEKSH